MRFNSSAGFHDLASDLRLPLSVLAQAVMMSNGRQNSNNNQSAMLWLCSSNGREQASHKREVGGSIPPTATTLISDCQLPICDCVISKVLKFEGKKPIGNQKSAMVGAGDVTDSIEVLQTSCEGLTPSRSTKIGDVAQLERERRSCKPVDKGSTPFIASNPCPEPRAVATGSGVS